jgi:2-polyprenyl-6-methoxyphenol hydroxylase-like FAD-dependent oxidoreductase
MDSPSSASDPERAATRDRGDSRMTEPSGVETDVLVVGAGPTGLMLANQLARRGVRARIIDRHAGPARETRALGVQARTLEIYAHLGVVDRALELGKRGLGANVWARGKRMARVPFGEAGKHLTPYPFVLILGQDDNERILGERLRDFGASVEWNTELAGLEQSGDRVDAMLKSADGSTGKLSAAWVAGCDGAKSSVRELSSIAFEGAPYEHVFYVADTRSTGSMIPDQINVYLLRRGFHLMFPLRGDDHWRIVGILPDALREKSDLKFDDVIPSLRDEAGAELTIRDCSWFSTYRIHHRSAARFRDRRCFLLGDAAHVHSPVGAQGMNTGLQDAYNLAWKIALVAQGRAEAALLDSYEEERMPIARRLLETTDRMFRLIISDRWWAGSLRTEVVARLAALAMSVKRIQLAAFRIVSQTGIHYRERNLSHDLDKLPHDAPRAGDRFPWLRLRFESAGGIEDFYDKIDDTRLALIVTGQAAPVQAELGLGDFVRIHSIRSDVLNDAELERARIPDTAFYLLRPDGHVGLCGRGLDVAAIRRYASERLRIATVLARQGVHG